MLTLDFPQTTIRSRVVPGLGHPGLEHKKGYQDKENAENAVTDDQYFPASPSPVLLKFLRRTRWPLPGGPDEMLNHSAHGLRYRVCRVRDCRLVDALLGLIQFVSKKVCKRQI